MHVTDREEALRTVDAVLSPALGEALRDELTHRIADVFEDHGDVASGPRGARVRRWVIRREDLEITRTITDALASLLAAQYLVPTGNWAPITAVVVSLIRTVRAIRQGGVMLDPGALVILLAVRARPGISTDALESLGKPDTLDILRRLGAYPLRDGRVIALVQQAGDGGWHSAV